MSYRHETPDFSGARTAELCFQQEFQFQHCSRDERASHTFIVMGGGDPTLYDHG
jgi:hypothetical protein